MSRPAGSRMKALDANAISVIACLTKPPFALAARVLPRVTAIVQRLRRDCCFAAAGESGSPRCGTLTRLAAAGSGACLGNTAVGAATGAWREYTQQARALREEQ